MTKKQRIAAQNVTVVLAMAAAMVGNDSAWGEDAEVLQEDLSESIQKSSEALSEFETPTEALGNFYDRLTLDYFGIFYGPSIKDPGIYQPSPQGGPDDTRPLLLKNYLSLGYRLSPQWSISGTGYWALFPVKGHGTEVRDPYFRIAFSSPADGSSFSLYSDLRVHFPVTDPSREADMLSSVQNFTAFTFIPTNSRLTMALYASSRVYVFGSVGRGNDLELYLAPFLGYRVLPTMSLTLLYEMGMSHVYGDRPFYFVNDGTDLEAGISWDITQNINFSPYVNLYPGNRVNLESSSLGFSLAWKIK